VYKSEILLIVLIWCHLELSPGGRPYCRFIIFEMNLLRRTFGLAGAEVTGDWRMLRYGELHNLYTPPYVVRILKQRRWDWWKRQYARGK
jgi:hypothetical protein